MKNYVQEGRALPMTAPAGGVVAGRLYTFGNIVGVAAVTADAGDSFTLETEGVFDLAKRAHANAEAVAVGDTLYLDADGGAGNTPALSKVEAGNTKCAVAVAAAVTGADTVRARLVFGASA